MEFTFTFTLYNLLQVIGYSVSALFALYLVVAIVRLVIAICQILLPLAAVASFVAIVVYLVAF